MCERYTKRAKMAKKRQVHAKGASASSGYSLETTGTWSARCQSFVQHLKRKTGTDTPVGLHVLVGKHKRDKVSISSVPSLHGELPIVTSAQAEGQQ